MSDSIVVIDLLPYQTPSWCQRHFQTQWSRQFCSQIKLFCVILTHGHGTTVDAILNTPTERSTIACGLFLWYFDRFLNIQGVVITNTRPLRADLFFLQDQLDKSYKFRVLGWQPNKGLMRESCIWLTKSAITYTNHLISYLFEAWIILKGILESWRISKYANADFRSDSSHQLLAKRV